MGMISSRYWNNKAENRYHFDDVESAANPYVWHKDDDESLENWCEWECSHHERNSAKDCADPIQKYDPSDEDNYGFPCNAAGKNMGPCAAYSVIRRTKPFGYLQANSRDCFLFGGGEQTPTWASWADPQEEEGNVKTCMTQDYMANADLAPIPPPPPSPPPHTASPSPTNYLCPW
mgnify:CR=1 FL=1